MAELETLEKFILFTKTAQTRCGVPFSFDAFKSGSSEKEPATAKGKVFKKGSSEDIELPYEIEWDMKGNALLLGKQFDLILEDPFEDA